MQSANFFSSLLVSVHIYIAVSAANESESQVEGWRKSWACISRDPWGLWVGGSVECTVNVPEDIPVGTAIGTIPMEFADDHDLLAEHIFSEQEPWSHFAVNTNTNHSCSAKNCAVLVKSPLDREKWSQYTLTALARRSGASDDPGAFTVFVKILINVTDVNDHPPHIHYCGESPIIALPSMAIGTRLWSFTIMDADSWVDGFGATVSGPDARYFRLSPRPEPTARTFDLEISEPLIRADKTDYNVTIIAKDQGNLTASCELRIVTFDTRPRFTSCPVSQRIHGSGLIIGEEVAVVSVESFWSMSFLRVAGDDADRFAVKFNDHRGRCMQEWCSERFFIVAKQAVNFGVQSEFDVRLNVTTYRDETGAKECHIRFVGGFSNETILPVLQPCKESSFTPLILLILLLVITLAVPILGYILGYRVARPLTKSEGRTEYAALGSERKPFIEAISMGTVQSEVGN